MNSRGRRTALLLVDFINPFDFPGRARMLERAMRAAKRTAALKARLRRRGVRCIYVNDNFGDWTSEFQLQVGSLAGKPGAEGAIARMLCPGKGDLSVLKPRHSGFYGTPLEFLLDELRVGKVVIAGVAADMCVHATAVDAHIRNYGVWVPADCVASFSNEVERAALGQLARGMHVDIRASTRRVMR